MLILADDETKAPPPPPDVNIPSEAWTSVPGNVSHVVNNVIQWAMWLGLLVIILAVIIYGAMLTIDRNRGESGIAMSDQARAVKIAIGIGLVCMAPGFTMFVLDAI